MALTDIKIRNTKPASKQIKMFDFDGLFLLVLPPGRKRPNGSKLWRFKYRFGGKEKLLALGTYPEIGLADARQRRDEARRQIAHGVDPGAVRKAQKQAQTEEKETFELIAREWHEKFKASWSSSHAHVTITRLERDIFPW
ncbi:MAG: Arm DNA-binding domain-containing protein, partial [Syntrophales bacterium]|nr:Arm DNA-binding domain-containing protein [Syntrophales bacterium]